LATVMCLNHRSLVSFFLIVAGSTEIYTLSLHDALPIWSGQPGHFLSSFRADHDAEQRDRPHIADQPQQPERWYDKHEDVHGGMPCSRSLLQALASIGPPPFPLRQRPGDADDDENKQQHTDRYVSADPEAGQRNPAE